MTGYNVPNCFKIVLILALHPLWVSSLFGKTIYITEKLSETIQKANDGDSIVVAGGSYNSNNTPIAINKRLTLIGAGFRTPANGGSEVRGGFHFKKSGSQLIGFRIINNSDANAEVLVLDGVSNCTIRNNNIYGPVRLQSSSIISFRNNTLKNDGKSANISIEGSGNIKIDNNIIYNKGGSASEYYTIRMGAFPYCDMKKS